MTKLVILTCLFASFGFFVNNAYGQSKTIQPNVPIDANVVAKPISDVQFLPSPVTSAPHSNKTSGDEKKVEIRSYFPDMLDESSPIYDKCKFLYFQKGGLGYLNGSLGKIGIKKQDGTEGEIMITDNGLAINVAKDQNRKFVWLSSVYVGFRSMEVNGDADKFKIKLYPIVDKRVRDTADYSYEFDLNRFVPEDVALDHEEAFLNAPTPSEKSEAKALNGSYLLMLETSGKDKDDLYSFYFSNPISECDLAEESGGWFIRYEDPEDPNFKVNGDGFNRFFKEILDENPGLEPDQPLIIPILTYETPNGVEDDLSSALASNRSLTLYGATPNPTNQQATIRYEYAKNASVQIRIMDMNGKLVHDSGPMTVAKGVHDYRFDASKLTCGTYSYIVQSLHGSLGGRFIVEKE